MKHWRGSSTGNQYVQLADIYRNSPSSHQDRYTAPPAITPFSEIVGSHMSASQAGVCSTAYDDSDEQRSDPSGEPRRHHPGVAAGYHVCRRDPGLSAVRDKGEKQIHPEHLGEVGDGLTGVACSTDRRCLARSRDASASHLLKPAVRPLCNCRRPIAYRMTIGRRVSVTAAMLTLV